MNTYKRLSENIRIRRAINGWSAAELGKRSKLSQSMLSNLETGTRKPSLDTMERLAKAFGITVQDLFSDKIEIKL